jgi:inward rectifier potassium channel
MAAGRRKARVCFRADKRFAQAAAAIVRFITEVSGMLHRLIRRLRRRPPPPSGGKASRRKTRTGEVEVVRIGHDPMLFRDLYVNLLSMPWAVLLLLVAGFYLLSNFLFAIAYYHNRDGLDHAKTFADVFFFSVQTMATIGYGRMAPVSLAVNLLATAEALWGFIYFAFVTGLMYSKFSRPTSQVLFSKAAVISSFDGAPHLKIRLANRRNNRIVDVTARLFLLRHETTKEGFAMRRFYDLKLVRDHMPLLRLTWTLMHPIDEHSPFHGLTHDDLQRMDDEVFVTIVGLDETLAQTIHARHSYFVDEIDYDAFFEDVVKRKDQSIEVNYNLFHSVRKTPPQGWV